MYCYAKQCYLATSYLLLSCYATACKHIVSRWTLPIIWYTLLVSVMVSNRNSYFAIACRAFPTIVSYVYHAPWWKHDYTATKAMDILLYTTHYSSDLFRSLHYYRPGLIIPTRKLNVLVINVFFLFLQQWFSTTSLKTAKSIPTILLDSRTNKFYHKSIDTFCVIALTKYVAQNIRGVTERDRLLQGTLSQQRIRH